MHVGTVNEKYAQQTFNLSVFKFFETTDRLGLEKAEMNGKKYVGASR